MSDKRKPLTVGELRERLKDLAADMIVSADDMGISCFPIVEVVEEEWGRHGGGRERVCVLQGEKD